MKKKELEELKFKDFLPVVYEDLEAHILEALENLRKDLIELSDDASEELIIDQFKNNVLRMNEISEDENFDNSIDTEEREGICGAYSAMSSIVGTDPSVEFVDEWREW